MVDCEAEGFLHMDDSKSKALINKFQFYFNHEPCEHCKEIHRGKPYD